MIGKQIDAVFEDIKVDAVKIGMLSSAKCMEAVTEKLRQYKPSHVVIDPVMCAKNGCPLMKMAAIDTLIKKVIPIADVLTPNIPEAEKIAHMSIQTAQEMETAARKIHNLGCRAVVVKGGHAGETPWIFCLTEMHFIDLRQPGSIPEIHMAQAALFRRPSPRCLPKRWTCRMR